MIYQAKLFQTVEIINYSGVKISLLYCHLPKINMGATKTISALSHHNTDEFDIGDTYTGKLCKRIVIAQILSPVYVPFELIELPGANTIIKILFAHTNSRKFKSTYPP